MEFVKQCVLKNGNLETVAWITEESAQVGKWVELDEDKSQWKVKSVGEGRVERNVVLDQSHKSKTIFKSINRE